MTTRGSSPHTYRIAAIVTAILLTAAAASAISLREQTRSLQRRLHALRVEESHGGPDTKRNAAAELERALERARRAELRLGSIRARLPIAAASGATEASSAELDDELELASYLLECRLAAARAGIKTREDESFGATAVERSGQDSAPIQVRQRRRLARRLLDLLIGARPSEIVAFEHPAIATDAPASDPTAAILARDQLRIQFRADERAVQRLVNAVAVDDMFLSVRRLSVRRAEDEHRRDRIFEIFVEQVARTGPSIISTTHAPQPAAWIPAAWTTPPEHEFLFASPAAPTVGSILEKTLEPRAHVSDPDTDARISELPPTPRTRPRVRVGAWIETPRGLRAVLVRAADDAARVVTAGERIEAWQVLVKEIRANPFRAVLRDETDGSEIEIREESLSPP